MINLSLNDRKTDKFENLRTGDTFLLEGNAFIKAYLSRCDFKDNSKYIGVRLDTGNVFTIDESEEVELVSLECKEVSYEG